MSKTIVNELHATATLDFEAQLVAALMIETNALVSIKTVTKLCRISRQEIHRRIHKGTFPCPIRLSDEDNAIRKAFRLQDTQTWLTAPHHYKQDAIKPSNLQLH